MEKIIQHEDCTVRVHYSQSSQKVVQNAAKKLLLDVSRKQKEGDLIGKSIRASS